MIPLCESETSVRTHRSYRVASDFIAQILSVSPIQSLLLFVSCLTGEPNAIFLDESQLYSPTRPTRARTRQRDDFQEALRVDKHGFHMRDRETKKYELLCVYQKSRVTPLPSQPSEQRSQEGSRENKTAVPKSGQLRAAKMPDTTMLVRVALL